MDMISISGLKKKYSNGDGVDNLTFSINRGEIVALLGPNGAGKTTTLRCVVGMYKPDAGTIVIGGHSPGSVQAQRMTAFIPDQPFLYPALTVAEHVQFRARAFGINRTLLKDKVFKALAEVNLAELADRMSGQLSRGQKQRVILAGAEVQNATVFILDEPTVGLDIPAKHWLVKWLSSKAADQGAALISTHSLEFVLETAHRVLLIQEGCLVGEMQVPREERDWPAWRQEVIRILGEWSHD